MALYNFDCPLDVAPPAHVVVHEPFPEITETVTVRALAPVPSAYTAAFLATPLEQWSWEQVRDYVVHQIETLHGAFPRVPYKEKAIFIGFLGRWPEHSTGIARYAFEVKNGFWRGAPVGVNRFCKASDSYFARPIAVALVAARPNL